MRRSVWLAIIVVLLALFSAGCSSCGVYVPTPTREPAAAPKSHSNAGTLSRDLSKDEAAGGHTLSRHVGRTDDELRQRLQHEHISAASTYTDRAAAEQAVGNALAANAHRINDWVASSGGHPNLVLGYESHHPIGRTLKRGDTTPRPCSHAVVVLKWVRPASYYVLTSYPERTHLRLNL